MRVIHLHKVSTYLKSSLDQLVYWDDLVHIYRFEGVLQNFEVVDVLVL